MSKFAQKSSFVGVLFLVAWAMLSMASAAELKVDFSKACGKIKPLHGLNDSSLPTNVPAFRREYVATGVPLVRSPLDVSRIFRDFTADENDPANYDFSGSDAAVRPIVDTGARMFFQLRTSVENDGFPDNDKWARICEHIVSHYNEGWANGFRWKVRHWEIWSEPENRSCWGGTREQFFELYRVTATHLKRRFPDLRVGGYGSSGFYAVDDPKCPMRNGELCNSFITWFRAFCSYVSDDSTWAPLDFFSWHLELGQANSPERIGVHADFVRKLLDQYGLNDAESILDEWNWNPNADWLRIAVMKAR